MRSIRTLLLFTCIVLFSLSAKAAPVIENPGTPAQGANTLHLEEMWRIGGEDDEDNLLGVIGQVMADDQDNIYLLDFQLVEVMVFDKEGQYIQSLGSQGEGPGEIRRAADVVFMPDGNIGLVQSFPGRIVQIDAAGIPAGEFRPGGDDPSKGGFFALRGAASRNGRMVFSGARITRGEKSRTAVNFVAAYGEEGQRTQLFYDKTSVREFRGQEFNETVEYFPHEGGWTLGPEGRVYINTDRNDYAINVYTPDGTLERTIKRPFQSWKRNDEEMQTAKDNIMPWRRRNRHRMNLVVDSTEKDIIRMRVADDGRLWVLNSRGLREQAEGIHSTWDVFDTDGKFEKTVAIACEGVGLRDRLFFTENGMVVLVKQYADALKSFRGLNNEENEEETEVIEGKPLEVICYRIK
ncbi:MAG: 6-bladed beta-propeller [bacterium]|nr:6-bladed beta-propeller [bacterium]